MSGRSVRKKQYCLPKRQEVVKPCNKPKAKLVTNLMTIEAKIDARIRLVPVHRLGTEQMDLRQVR